MPERWSERAWEEAIGTENEAGLFPQHGVHCVSQNLSVAGGSPTCVPRNRLVIADTISGLDGFG